MLKNEHTNELEELEDEYELVFGVYPDDYIDICYDAMTYDVYVECIRKALKEKKELPYIKGVELY